MESELQLYLDGPRLVDFLRHWTNPSKNLPDRLVALLSELESDGFIGRGDVQLARAWIADLNRVGYEWPPVEIWDRNLADKESAAQAQAHPQLDIETAWTVNGCDPNRPVFDDVLLVVVINTPMGYGSIPTFKEIHDR
jgi:hypothetical protein